MPTMACLAVRSSAPRMTLTSCSPPQRWLRVRCVGCSLTWMICTPRLRGDPEICPVCARVVIPQCPSGCRKAQCILLVRILCRYHTRQVAHPRRQVALWKALLGGMDVHQCLELRRSEQRLHRPAASPLRKLGRGTELRELSTSSRVWAHHSAAHGRTGHALHSPHGTSKQHIFIPGHQDTVSEPRTGHKARHVKHSVGA